ncbi:hypothetical protein TNCV_4837421 [Trichonephila clavipes]|nr:hypothetical protein TNCV_4837421 [Trichonephila clavipes]
MEPIDMAYDFYEAPDSSADLPPIILIHGMVWNKYMFRELAEKLCLATKRKKGHPDLNRGSLDLQTNALPLSYPPRVSEPLLCVP